MHPTFLDPPVLLNDDDMAHFIREGYLTLQSSLPRAFHDTVYQELTPLEENGRLGHNNLLPCVPQIREVLDEPHIRGALQSLLGPDYYLHFHRHDHVNFPDAAQPLHKDGDNHSHFAVDGIRRYHPTRYVMLLYYPQDTPVERGPTGIVPRSQYTPRTALETARSEWGALTSPLMAEVNKLAKGGASETERQMFWRTRYADLKSANAELYASLKALEAPWEARKIPLHGPAGTVSIVHFDLVHGRFGPNQTDVPRHMVKFLFSRYREPVTPSWDATSSTWPGSADDALTPVYRYQWDWHRGARAEFADSAQGNLETLTRSMTGDDEVTALAATYDLATHGDAGVCVLMEQFLADEPVCGARAGWGLAAAGKPAVGALLKAAQGADAGLTARIADVLGDIGAAAFEATAELRAWCEHEDANVRLFAVEALAMVTEGRGGDAALTPALEDTDDWVRRNAVIGVARAGAGSSDPVPTLAANLYHPSHQVRGWTIEALQRLGNPRASEIALRYLNTTRWDHNPKSGDPNVRKWPGRR